MLSVCFWVAFGAIVGWIAVILRENDDSPHTGLLICLGIVGGIIGGIGGSLLDASSVTYQTSTTDIMFAVFGASLLVIMAEMATNARRP